MNKYVSLIYLQQPPHCADGVIVLGVQTKQSSAVGAQV